MQEPTAFSGYIGNPEIVKDMIDQLIAFHNSNVMKTMNLPTASSIILHGPGGTGKTLFAKLSFQAAQEISQQFGENGFRFKWFEFECSKLVSKYRGEFELNLQKEFNAIFAYVDEHPLNKAVILFDEFDSIAGAVKGSSDDTTSIRVLNALKVNLSRDQIQEGCLLIACTNNYDELDEAVVRDGRFNKKIFIDYTKSIDDIRKLVKFFLTRKELIQEISEEYIEGIVKVLFASGITTPSMVNTLVERAVLNSTKELIRKHPSFNFQIVVDHNISAATSKRLIILYFDEKHLHGSFETTASDLTQRVDDTERLQLIQAILPTIKPKVDFRNEIGHPQYEDPLKAICRVKPGSLDPNDPSLTAEEIKAELFYYKERLDQLKNDSKQIQRLSLLAEKLANLPKSPEVTQAAQTDQTSSNKDSVIDAEIVKENGPELTEEDNLATALVVYSYNK